MAMPPQLARGLLAKRYSHCRDPRPVAEELAQIDVNDLHIPRDQRTYTAPHISLFLNTNRITFPLGSQPYATSATTPPYQARAATGKTRKTTPHSSA